MKVLITPRSYGKTDPGVFEMLKEAGIDYSLNDTAGILSKEQMIERLRDCNGVIIGVDPLDGEVINAAES